jgi:P-type Cu+ transporter
VTVMRKWAIAGMLYVTAIIFGFQAYEKWIADEESVAQADMENMDAMKKINEETGDTGHSTEETGSSDHKEEAMTDGHEGEEEAGSHGHESDTSHTEGSQVNTFVMNDQNNIKIFLKDRVGNPVDDLEVSHEKIFHLILVDEQLQKYYHVHPERTAKGEFTINNPLPDGYYKAFVDIKPKNLSYEVEPVPFVVGNPASEDHGHPLVPDINLNKTVDGEDVTLNISSFKANEPVTLSFNLDKTNLTPYLGAMGHVVILDEYGKKFLHVHPSNDKEPIFETEFDKPGIYKIWAEFQQNGKVRAFPFVIEVTE